jgi:hypothetical protein
MNNEQEMDTVPLTTGQKARLMAGCIPFSTFALMCLIYLTVLRDVVGAPPPIMLGFMGVVLLVLGYDVIQRLRDLVSGVAMVQPDVLVRSWRSRGRGKAHYYGKFEQLGRLRLIPSVHFQSPAGGRYRVIYSPVSKIVWSLERLS